MNNRVFEKIKDGNIEIHRKIKSVTVERKRNYFLPEQNYHTTKFIRKNVLAIEMKAKTKTNKQKKAEILMNKPVHLGLPVLELSKILMYEFWCDYVVKQKFCENVKWGYADTDTVLLYT